MGFFSWKCCKTDASIPAFPAAKKAKRKSQIVLVLPDNLIVEGLYDGYGNITTKYEREYDIYAVIARYLPNYDGTGRDFVFNRNKDWLSPDGQEKFTTHVFSWEEILPETKMTMNQMKAAGWTHEDNFMRAQALIKIVRADAYYGEGYEELETSKNCPAQGFFY